MLSGRTQRQRRSCSKASLYGKRGFIQERHIYTLKPNIFIHSTGPLLSIMSRAWIFHFLLLIWSGAFSLNSAFKHSLLHTSIVQNQNYKKSNSLCRSADVCLVGLRKENSGPIANRTPGNRSYACTLYTVWLLSGITTLQCLHRISIFSFMVSTKSSFSFTYWLTDFILRPIIASQNTCLGFQACTDVPYQLHNTKIMIGPLQYISMFYRHNFFQTYNFNICMWLDVHGV